MMNLFFFRTIFSLLLLSLLIVVSPGVAHDHSLATWEISPNGERGLSLQVDFVQAAAHEALFEKHGRSAIMGISRAEYEDLVVDYIEERTRLRLDGTPLRLEESERRIEDHASLVVFSLSPEQRSGALEVELLAFTESARQRQLLRVKGPSGVVVHEGVLDRRDAYRARLTDLWGGVRGASVEELNLLQGLTRGALILVALAALVVVGLELWSQHRFD